MNLNKQTLDDVDVKGKRVLIRVDFNVPQDKKTGEITNNQRIVGAIPTIQKALDHGAKAVILMSHLGRPNGNVVPRLTLKPIADRLSELIGKPVTFLNDCVGPQVEEACADPAEGSITLLENLRFHAAEEGKGKDPDGKAFKPTETEVQAFRDSLSKLGDVYVNDAFGTCHRAHSSMVGVKGKMPCVAGDLVTKELSAFSQVIGDSVQRPLTAIVGGAKISDKILVIENLIDRADAVIICGGMAYTFMKECYGMKIGKSLYDKKGAELAPKLLKKAQDKGVSLILPCDWACGREFKNDQEITMVTNEEGIPDDLEGMDCGPESMKLFHDQIMKSKTVVWNGPAGVFEFDNFSKGTKALLESVVAMTKAGGRGIIGGGDSATAAAKWNLESEVTFCSTGGGASLELLEGKILPGIAALSEDDRAGIPKPLPGQSRKRNVFDVLDTLAEGQAADGAKKILVRVDFNVPMTAEGEITDDSRIRGALPTIRAITKAKCNAILVSHMGRPKLVQKGEDNEETREQRAKLSLRPVAKRLKTLIDTDVSFAEDCLGSKAEDAVAALPKAGGGILLLENLRFYKQEEKNDEDFAKSLASYADAYVNDAFGTCHRAHASVSGVPAQLPNNLCGVGCLVASEISYLDFSSLQEGDSVAAVIGGSKVSTKLPVIKGLLKQVNTLILGGGLAFTFLKAQGVSIGNSLVEDSMIDTAKELLSSAKESGKNLVIPVDAVCTTSFPSAPMKLEETKTFDLVPGAGIDDGYMGLDVGPKTVALFKDALKDATKLVLNGPMGVFEVKPFDKGTEGLVNVLEEITNAGCVTVVGGGDSVAALEAFGKTHVVSYVSTGGGATLELLAGDILPGVAAISDIE